jgi:hypothetical protein
VSPTQTALRENPEIIAEIWAEKQCTRAKEFSLCPFSFLCPSFLQYLSLAVSDEAL